MPATALARWLQFAAAVFPASIYVGTQTVANAVLPQMQGDLLAGIDQISWVVTVGVVAGAIGIPPTSWLAARFGRRRLVMTCMMLFGIAAVFVGLSDTLAGVIFWRAVAAFVGAPVVALSQAVTLDTFPEEERGMAFAFWAIGILSGWVFAPALGAYLSELESWRLIFFALGPVALCGAAAASTLRETPKNLNLLFDWFGFGALSVGLASALLVLNRGQRLDWFESGEMVFFAALAVVSFYVFIAHTMTSQNPFLRFGMFKDRNYALGIPLVFAYAALSLAPLVLIPTMLKGLKGLELLTTGLLLVPRGIAQILGLLVVGPLLNRVDARIWVGTGLILFSVAGFQMANYNESIGLADVIWPNLIQGFAMAMIWVPIANLIYSNLAVELRTDATTVVSLLYSLASSIGVAVAVVALVTTTQVNHQELAGHLVHSNEVLRGAEYAWLWRPGDVAALQTLQGLVSQQAQMVAYINVYFGMSVAALCVLPFVFFLRRPR
ncbi:MAG: DHA2 family efflux MFS transporter permease subunit [Pseudomonadota bacterium]